MEVKDVQDLIPALPEDVAVDCLACLPYRCHHRLRLVSKSWNTLFSDPSFYCHRKLASRADALVFVVLTVPSNCDDQPRAGYYGAVSLYNITYQTWVRLPGTSPSYPVGIASDWCMGVGSKVVLLGGWDSHTWDPSSNEGLRSCEAYDVETDTWTQLPDMQHVWRRSLGYSVGSRLVVVEREESGEIFDPCTWEWALPRPCNPNHDGGGKEGRIKGSLLPLLL